MHTAKISDEVKQRNEKERGKYFIQYTYLY